MSRTPTLKQSRRPAYLAIAAAFGLAGAAPFSKGAEFDAAAATNQFGLTLYRVVSEGKAPGNLAFSPYSIESCMALAYAGSDGQTRSEMGSVFSFPADEGEVKGRLAALKASLSSAAAPLVWHDANGLFVKQGFQLRKSFVDELRNDYGAEFREVDFSRTAARQINQWVSDVTQGRISQIVPGSFDPEKSRLVLVNAVYLKAAWADPFAKSKTRPLPFHSPGTADTRIPTMHTTREIAYREYPDYQVAAFPYDGGGLQMLIILPKKTDGLAATERSLSADSFAQFAALSTTTGTLVDVFLPKFHIETDLPLQEALRSMGLRTAFDLPKGSANFDRAAPRLPNDYLFISDVYHKAWLDVDEKGTEAAAATGGVMLSTFAVSINPPTPIIFRADHPFLFAIQDCKSGVCVFLGAVVHPGSSTRN